MNTHTRACCGPQICRVINTVQTHQLLASEQSARATEGRRQAPVAPVAAPAILNLPRELVGATGAYLRAQPHGTLSTMLVHAREQIAAALGVPSVLLASHGSRGGVGGGANSTSLRVFNSSCRHLANTVEVVLSAAYRQIYGETEQAAAAVVRLSARVTPLINSTEIGDLVSSGVLDARLGEAVVLRQLGIDASEYNVRPGGEPAAGAAGRKRPRAGREESDGSDKGSESGESGGGESGERSS